MNEIIPVLLGAGSGLLVGQLTARYGWWPWLLVSVVLGVTATVVTGEWRLSWEYLLIDIPLVALSSIAVFAITHRPWAPATNPDSGTGQR